MARRRPPRPSTGAPIPGTMNTWRRLTFNLWYNWKPPWDTGISPPELIDFISRHPAASGPGLEESDLEAISAYLNLVNRQDGSERGLRRSAWLTFERRR